MNFNPMFMMLKAEQRGDGDADRAVPRRAGAVRPGIRCNERTIVASHRRPKLLEKGLPIG